MVQMPQLRRKNDEFRIARRRPSLNQIGFLILIVVVIGATILLLLSTLNPALLGLLGVIVGAVFGIIGTTLNTIYFEPHKRQRTLEDDAKQQRRALYNQLMHQYIFAKNASDQFIRQPKISFKYSTYISVQTNPIAFYSMVPDAEAIDLAFSAFQSAQENILRMNQESGTTQLEVVENLTQYISFLVVNGYLDLNLIKEVCNTTRTEKQAVIQFEDNIAEIQQRKEARNAK